MAASDRSADRAGTAKPQGADGMWRERSQATLRERVERVRDNLGLAVQAAVAAGLSWFIANDLIGSPDPFFAPIAAVIALASAVGERLRQTLELIVGVALGIAIGDALILWIGTGAWQIAVVVVLAVIVSIFVGGGAALVNNAAASAVLVATLRPPSGGIYVTRFIDALVGGAVGVAVLALLLPLNPLRVVDRAASRALDVLADSLTDAGEALGHQDPGRAQAALQRLRDAEDELRELEDAIEAGRETATLAPVRWGKRAALARYVASSEYIGRALRDSRTLVRRAVTAIEDREAVPPTLPPAVKDLGEAVRLLHRELGAGRPPERARERAAQAVSEAAEAYSAGVGFSGSSVVALVRSISSDLIAATGLNMAEANRLVRRVADSKDHPGAGGPGETRPGETPAG
jgi:uncharacterized membrane protein YgaE (UPF0421/DUF939 family)